MSFANYQDLQDSIKSWLAREDSATIARIPDFITFGENRIFRQLRSRANEVTQIFDSQSGDNTQGITLPDDFKEVKLITYDGKMLERKSDQWFLTRDPLAAGGIPLYFVRLGNELRFWRGSDENSDVVMIYYNQQVHIDDENVPPLYLEIPELYLFGALLEAKPWLKSIKPEDVILWQGKYDQTFDSLMGESWEAEYAGSSVAVSGAYSDGGYRRSTGSNS